MKWVHIDDDDANHSPLPSPPFYTLQLDCGDNFSQFQPEEIRVTTVTTADGTGADLVIEANHADRIEHQGHVTRNFQGRIALPLDMNANSITSWLTPEGRLVVSAHRQTGSPRERLIGVFPLDPLRHQSYHTKVSPGGP